MDDRALAKRIGIEARRRAIPAGGLFELTPQCTLDCKMCYVHLTKEQMHGRTELSTQKWIEIIDAAYQKGLLFMLLTGGECLLHKGFWEIYEHVKSLGLIVTVNSNGTIITDNDIERFKKSPPRSINISLYGNSEDTYEKVTGHRICDKVKRTILKLRDAGIPVKISITPSKYLIDDVPALLKFSLEEKVLYNVNTALMQAFDETGRSIDDYGLSAEDCIRLERLKCDAVGGKRYENDQITSLPEIDTSGKELRGFPCSAGKATFTISWDGIMHPCLWGSDISENVLEEGFEQAWEKINKRTKEHLMPIECVKCKYLSRCLVCSIARMDPNNPGHCNPEVCKATIGIINAGLYRTPQNEEAV